MGGREGCWVGRREGCWEGCCEGQTDGQLVGAWVGLGYLVSMLRKAVWSSEAPASPRWESTMVTV